MWTCFLPEMLPEFTLYKFCVTAKDGQKTYKSDPYAYHYETRPGNASLYYEVDGYVWQDEAWQRAKKRKPHYAPVSYTHLDVYKRQPLHKFLRRSRGPGARRIGRTGCG